MQIGNSHEAVSCSYMHTSGDSRSLDPGKAGERGLRYKLIEDDVVHAGSSPS